MAATHDQAAPVVEPSGLVGLVARVEAATGADRELDRAIAWMLALWDPIANRRVVLWVQPFTASLDAALALCARVLPAGIMLNIGASKSARIWPLLPVGGSYEGIARTPALALLAAMLKALIALAADTSEGEGIGSSVAESGGTSPVPGSKSDNHNHSEGSR